MSGGAASLAAQAKVNLFLHVLEREASGYHQIQTLFCRLDLADDVIVRIPGPGSPATRALDSVGEDTGPAGENLAYRAAALYAERRGWPSGFAIEITKRIPVGGGLGGGSADAGGVLRVLRALDPAPPPAAALLQWAAQLGADVPFMTIESPLALGAGRGDTLVALPALPPRGVVLYLPGYRVSTREAYGWLDDARAAHPVAPPPSRRTLGPGGLTSWDQVAPLMTNDFESVVGQRYSDVALMASRLRAVPNAIAALMSGSGSTVYGVMDALAAPRGAIIAPASGTMLMTSTAEHVVGVRRID